MKYFISDNHWGHKAIIRMENRPFSNVHEMNISMIESWNSVVKPGDEVYHLGDISHKINPSHLINILNQLNGKIYLISGNHDKPNILNKIGDRFEWIEKYHEFNYNHKGDDYKFVLFHNPIYSWNGLWRGSIHLCGHTHKNSSNFFNSHVGRIMNVSCEMLDYKPISIVDVIEKMKDKLIVPPNRTNDNGY